MLRKGAVEKVVPSRGGAKEEGEEEARHEEMEMEHVWDFRADDEEVKARTKDS